MYSDMSMRISASSSSKRNAASARASSVLPDAGGPEEDERADRPARDRAGRRGCGAPPSRPRRPPRPGRRRACRSSSSMRRSFSGSSSSSLTHRDAGHHRDHVARSSSASTIDFLLAACASLQFFLSSLQPRAQLLLLVAQLAPPSRTPGRWIAGFLLLRRPPRACFSSSRISAGTVATDRRARAPASSITSIALSGKEAVVHVAVGELHRLHRPPRR